MADFSLVPSGEGTNYTGMLTRSIVFSAALFVFLAGMQPVTDFNRRWIDSEQHLG